MKKISRSEENILVLVVSRVIFAHLIYPYLIREEMPRQGDELKLGPSLEFTTTSTGRYEYKTKIR